MHIWKAPNLPQYAVSVHLSHLKCLSCASLRRDDHARLDDDVHEWGMGV
jgi:hypothetical protein